MVNQKSVQELANACFFDRAGIELGKGGPVHIHEFLQEAAGAGAKTRVREIRLETEFPQQLGFEGEDREGPGRL